MQVVVLGCLDYLAPGLRPSYPSLGPRLLKNFKLAQPPPTSSPVTIIIVYGFFGYSNHVDLLMPHVHVLKKRPYCLLCT